MLPQLLTPFRFLHPSLILSAILSVSASAAIEERPPTVEYPSTVEQVLADWPEKTFQAAQSMMEKYGMPDEISESQMIWYDTGPWKRTVLNKETIQHNFPAPHQDYLEQVIDYQVPPEKFDELALYDGSVIVERTKGELSARCHIEAANFLAINLAHDIITENKTVEEAREAYAKTIVQSQTGEMPESMKGFTFPLPLGETADPDVVVIDQD